MEPEEQGQHEGQGQPEEPAGAMEQSGSGVRSGPAAQRIPIRRRVRAWALVGLVYGVLAAMVGGGVWFLSQALRGVHNGGDPWRSLIFGVLLLTVPGTILWPIVRRRWKTGSWAVSPEERARLRAQCAVRRSSRRIVPGPWGALQYLVQWGRYAAFDKALPGRVRACGWAAVTLWIGFVASVALMAAMCGAAAFADDNTPGQAVMWLALAVLLLCYPGLWTRAAIRRRRETGFALKLRADDVAGMGESWHAWRLAEGRKSASEKRNTLVGQIIVLAILLAMKRRVGVSYVFVAVWAIWAVYLAVVMYAGAGREQVESE